MAKMTNFGHLSSFARAGDWNAGPGPKWARKAGNSRAGDWNAGPLVIFNFF